MSIIELRPESALATDGTQVDDLIRSRDGRHYVLEHGASADVQFRVPDVAPGRNRSYLLRSSGWYRIHGPEQQPADIALLRRVLTEPHGASRVAVARFNDAMLALDSRRD